MYYKEGKLTNISDVQHNYYAVGDYYVWNLCKFLEDYSSSHPVESSLVGSPLPCKVWYEYRIPVQNNWNQVYQNIRISKMFDLETYY